jgi:hypothetical protein
MNKREVAYPTPTETGRIVRYERKFSEKAFNELMAKADPSKKGGVNFVVYYANGNGISGPSAPIAIHDRETFVHGKFEDICKVQQQQQQQIQAQAPTSSNTTTNKA